MADGTVDRLLLVRAHRFRRRADDLAVGGDIVRPLDGACLQVVQADALDRDLLLAERVLGVFGPRAAGGVDEDPAAELRAPRGGEEGVDLRLRDGLARLPELALDSGEPGFVTELCDEVDAGVGAWKSLSRAQSAKVLTSRSSRDWTGSWVRNAAHRSSKAVPIARARLKRVLASSWRQRSRIESSGCIRCCGSVRRFVLGPFCQTLTNLSPKMTANCVLASYHFRGGRFHASAA